MGSIKLVELLEQPTTKMNDELSTGWMNQPTNKAFRHVETLFVQGRNLVPWTNKVSTRRKALCIQFKTYKRLHSTLAAGPQQS